MDLLRNSRHHRLRIALVTVLAVAVCISLSELLHLQYAVFSAISSTVIITMFFAQSLQKALERTLGVLMAVLGAAGIVWLLLEIPPAYLVATALWIYLCFSLRSYTPYVFASIIAGIYSAVLLNYAIDSPGSVRDFSLHLLIQTTLGVSIALWAKSLLAPRIEQATVYLSFADVVQSLGNELAALARHFGSPADVQRSAETTDPKTYQTLIDLARRFATQHHDARALGHRLNIIDRCQQLQEQISDLSRSARLGALRDCPQSVADTASQALASLGDRLEILSARIRDRQPVSTTAADYGLSIAAVDAAADAWHRADHSGTPNDEGGAVDVLMNALHSIARDVCLLERAHNRGVSGQWSEDKLVESQRYHIAPGPPVHGFSWKDNTKTTIAAVVIILAGVFLDLPASLQCLITALVMTAVPRNLGHAHLTLKLRFLGILAGVAYGLMTMLVVAWMPYFPIFLIMVSVGVFFGAYVCAGPERYSYMGLQAILALILMLLVNDGPIGALGIVEQRVAGVVIGGAIGLALQYLLWPVDPGREATRTVAQALDSTSAALTAWLVQDTPAMEPLTKLGRCVQATRLAAADVAYQRGLSHSQTDRAYLQRTTVDDIYSACSTIYAVLFEDKPTQQVRQFLDRTEAELRVLIELIHSQSSWIAQGHDPARDLEFDSSIRRLKLQFEKQALSFQSAHKMSGDLSHQGHQSLSILLDALRSILAATRILNGNRTINPKPKEQANVGDQLSWA